MGETRRELTKHTCWSTQIKRKTFIWKIRIWSFQRLLIYCILHDIYRVSQRIKGTCIISNWKTWIVLETYKCLLSRTQLSLCLASSMLSYGCTRLEIGVQSVYEDVARDTNRYKLFWVIFELDAVKYALQFLLILTPNIAMLAHSSIPGLNYFARKNNANKMIFYLPTCTTHHRLTCVYYHTSRHIYMSVWHNTSHYPVIHHTTPHRLSLHITTHLHERMT